MSTADIASTATVRQRYSPYQGLVPYSEADADWFFGRDEWSAIVADNLRAYRVTVLYGASGVGKSSLLRAGMIRMLNDELQENIAEHGLPRLLPVAFSGWSLDRPLVALRDIVCDAAEVFLSDVATLSRESSLTGALENLPARLGGPLLLVLDQLEELLVYHGRSDDATLAELTAVLRRRDPAVHFLLSIREDALADLDRFEGHVSGLGDHLLRLEHLDREAGREAITAPLERWNRVVAEPGDEVQIEPALVEAMLDQVTAGQVALGTSSVAASNRGRAAGVEAPYLQLVLTRLWDDEQRAGSHALRLETLQRLGGADRIVRTHLDTALAALPPDEQEVAARTFRYLVTPSGTKIALRIADLADYASVSPEKLESLVEHLAGGVRVLRPAGDGRFEIYHDALAGPILDWRGRWDEQRRRRRERHRLLVFSSAFVALLALVTGVSLLAVWALNQRQSAQRRETSATALALASAANLQQNHRLDVSLLLAREAYELNPSPEARESLITSFQRARQVAALGIFRADTLGVNSVALSPDGQRLATAGGQVGVRLWDVRTGRRIQLRGTTKGIQSVAFSPDGRMLAGGKSFVVRRWDVRSGRQLRPMRGHKAGVPTVEISPDGRTVASASTDGVRLWDARTGRGRGAPLPHTDGVWSLAFSPDGHTLATGSHDKTVRLWDVTTRTQLGRPLRGHRGEVTDVAFSPDGSVLASAGQTIRASTLSNPPTPRIIDHTVRLWNVRTHEELGPPLRGHTDSVTSIAFHPNGTLASGSADRTIRFWDVRRHKAIRHSLSGHTASVTSLAFNADGSMLASAGGATDIENRGADQTVRLWDVRGRRLDQVLRGHTGRVTSVAYSPDGRRLASGGADQSIQLWDARSGRQLSGRSDSPPDDLYAIESVAYSPDGTMLAAGAKGRGLVLVDLRTRTPIGKPLPAIYPESVVFSPDGSLVASADQDGVRLWDVRRHRQLGRVMQHVSPDGHVGVSVASVAFSPDGQTLASGVGDGGTIWLWDVRSQEQLGRLSRHPPGIDISGVAFSPDGRVLASAEGVDGTVRFWDVESHDELGSPLRGHVDAMAVAFSPDGRTLATGGGDNTVRLWDVQSGRQLGQPLRGHSGYVESVAFSPDGRTLASASADGTVRLWKGFLFGAEDRAYMQRRVCSFAGGNLSPAEWAESVPGIAYRATCP
jgi:WD40 repeat protein